MTSTDSMVVLHQGAAGAFLADACRALADSVNAIGVAGPAREEAVEVYAELVGAFARFKLGRRDAGISQVDRDIVAHLLERIREARAGETAIPLADIVDQLHARVEAL
jgi:hypothetical protein